MTTFSCPFFRYMSESELLESQGHQMNPQELAGSSQKGYYVWKEPPIGSQQPQSKLDIYLVIHLT